MSLVEFLFKQSFNPVVKGVTNFACDQLGEFVGKGVTNLVFNAISKPSQNYKELIYEESVENNKNAYLRNIFSLPYINEKLEKLKDENSIEITGDDYTKYAADIIPSEERLTKSNHIFSPLGNLILAELSSAYLRPKLIREYSNELHFLKQFEFEWTYTNTYNEINDNIDLNTFLVDDKYVLFNNMDCNKTKTAKYEFYIAIKKVGENVLKFIKILHIFIYKNIVILRLLFGLRILKI